VRSAVILAMGVQRVIRRGAHAGSVRLSLDWLCPRPTRLVHGPLTGRAQVVDAFTTNASITRADVAAWMLDALALPRWPAPAWGSRHPQISAG
jgi:hypothetical protein